MAALRENREFLITDPLHNNDFPTSQGVLKVDRDGYLKTRKRDLAQEIKAREPWAIVTEHGGFYGGGRTRAVTITVPELPWKKNRSWLQRLLGRLNATAKRKTKFQKKH